MMNGDYLLHFNLPFFGSPSEFHPRKAPASPARRNGDISRRRVSLGNSFPVLQSTCARVCIHEHAADACHPRFIPPFSEHRSCASPTFTFSPAARPGFPIFRTRRRPTRARQDPHDTRLKDRRETTTNARQRYADCRPDTPEKNVEITIW